MKERFWLYMILCSNGNYYTGYTTDIFRRLEEHKSGKKGAKYTKAFKYRSLSGCWLVKSSRGDILRAEYFLRKLNRKRKDYIVSNPVKLADIIVEKSEIDLKIYFTNPELIVELSSSLKDAMNRDDLFLNIKFCNILTGSDIFCEIGDLS